MMFFGAFVVFESLVFEGEKKREQGVFLILRNCLNCFAKSAELRTNDTKKKGEARGMTTVEKAAAEGNKCNDRNGLNWWEIR